jgi:hypothetical protein
MPQMHQFEIVAQISLILSVLNLALAAPGPIVVRGDTRSAWRCDGGSRECGSHAEEVARVGSSIAY